MKKILISLLVLMLSLTAFSQRNCPYFHQGDSQIENLTDYRSTISTYAQKIIDSYGIDEFHAIVKSIEAGTIDEYVKIRQELVRHINFNFSFVENGKIFVMTYEPYVDNMSERKLNLYRMDDDGWKVAAEVRTDYRRNDDTEARDFDAKTNMSSGYSYPNFGSVFRVIDGSVVMTFSSSTSNSDGNETFYSLVVFTPNNSPEIYNASYFEPTNKYGKILKKESLNYEFNKLYVKDNEGIRLPILCGTYATAYEKLDDGIKIQYWDGNVSNRVDAGTIELKILGTYVTASGSIELNKIK